MQGAVRLRMLGTGKEIMMEETITETKGKSGHHSPPAFDVISIGTVMELGALLGRHGDATN